MKSTIDRQHANPFSPRRVLRVLLVTGALLLVPLLSMLAGGAFDWGPVDFVAAAVLLAGTGMALELAWAKLRTARARAIAATAIVLALLAAWAELAVGIFH